MIRNRKDGQVGPFGDEFVHLTLPAVGTIECQNTIKSHRTPLWDFKA